MFDRLAGTRRTRRAAWGWLWTVAWCAVLYAFARPWPGTRFDIDERLRWAGRVALTGGLWCGFVVGEAARRSAVRRGSPTHRGLLRRASLPAVGVGVLGVAALHATGRTPLAWVVLQAALAVAAGLDLGFAAVPLIDGEPYAFSRPLPPPRERASEHGDDANGGPELL